MREEISGQECVSLASSLPEAGASVGLMEGLALGL